MTDATEHYVADRFMPDARAWIDAIHGKSPAAEAPNALAEIRKVMEEYDRNELFAELALNRIDRILNG
jgi:hypothetical protein